MNDIRRNTLEECLNYWINPQDHNVTKSYVKKYTKERSEYLCNLFLEYNIPKNNSIFEIGCNCCRNLNYLYQRKYKLLTGIEISKKALDLQKEIFPELKAILINSSIEDYILKINDKEFETVFTMAVLQHIHIDSNWIFEHIARITKHRIIIIELEVRDYNKIFSKFGFKRIKYSIPKNVYGLSKYKTMIFERNN